MDIDPITGAMRCLHMLVQIIPPGWDVENSKWRSSHSGDAHLIPIIKELRMAAPAGSIKMEALIDCELRQSDYCA